MMEAASRYIDEARSSGLFLYPARRKYDIIQSYFPLPMEELQKSLMELLTAVNTGKDSL